MPSATNNIVITPDLNYICSPNKVTDTPLQSSEAAVFAAYFTAILRRRDGVDDCEFDNVEHRSGSHRDLKGGCRSRSRRESRQLHSCGGTRTIAFTRDWDAANCVPARRGDVRSRSHTMGRRQIVFLCDGDATNFIRARRGDSQSYFRLMGRAPTMFKKHIGDAADCVPVKAAAALDAVS